MIDAIMENVAVDAELWNQSKFNVMACIPRHPNVNIHPRSITSSFMLTPLWKRISQLKLIVNDSFGSAVWKKPIIFIQPNSTSITKMITTIDDPTKKPHTRSCPQLFVVNPRSSSVIGVDRQQHIRYVVKRVPRAAPIR